MRIHFLECVKYRHGDTDEEKISYVGSRYDGFRDAWFPRDGDVADVRELRIWRWIIRFSRSSDFSRWDLRCEFCLYILLHSTSPVQERWAMCAFPYLYVQRSDSVDLIAKRRLKQNNNTEHYTCIVLGSSNEKIMSGTYFLKICKKRQIVSSKLRYTLNTKHWVLTGNSQKRQSPEHRT